MRFVPRLAGVLALAILSGSNSRAKDEWDGRPAYLLPPPAVLEAILAAWAVYDPHRHHPYRIALEGARDWARREKDRFDPQFGASEKECSLKIAYLEFFWDDIHEEYSYAKRTASVSRAGEWVMSSNGPEYSILESSGKLSTETLTAVASELSSLPPADHPIPLGNAVVIVGYPERGGWTTRIYGKTRHGPRLRRLTDMVALGLR
jgi:hypothetical protein